MNKRFTVAAMALAAVLASACAVPQTAEAPVAPVDPDTAAPDYGAIMDAARSYYTAQKQAGNRITYAEAVRDEFMAYFRDNFHDDYDKYVMLETDSRQVRLPQSRQGAPAVGAGGMMTSIEDPVYHVYMGSENDDEIFLDYDYGRIIIRPLYKGTPVLTYVQYYNYANTVSIWFYGSSYSDYTSDEINAVFLLKGQVSLNDPYFYTHFTPAMLRADMSDALKCWYAGSMLNVFSQNPTVTYKSECMAYAWVTMPGNILSSNIPDFASLEYHIEWGMMGTYHFDRVYTF